jgi:hypothetical protein
MGITQKDDIKDKIEQYKLTNYYSYYENTIVVLIEYFLGKQILL